ncbi:TRAP transporter large permease [Ureibacillus acetophenoni]|uniref:C4-dicarboxylate transporter DctM subunit n=1 Tax=Ureibacillus acetophenoni TaxID=614649 RepID=A0A285U7P0_9BACL|nr:TRAP transporter large permease [Ureibacillus acetophenoni]SOC37839.1 C4-dicarboxylate transporter DctM subunit [Ureibacillus acetophenoni]
MEYLLIIAIFLVLLLLGLPVAFSLAMVGAGVLYFFMDPQMANLQVPQVLYNSLNNNLLIAIPAFILTGHIILKSGIGTKAFNVADKWFGHYPGGLAIGTVITCAFFASMSGSSVATVVTLGYIASAEMIKNGYPKRLAYGVIAAAGTLGILIPPSGPMILYGAMTQESVSDLFMAGIIPGILLVLLFIVYILAISTKLPRKEKASMSERIDSLKEIIWVFSIPIIIIGGIYSGIFTVTEAAAVACVVSLFLGIFVYKSVRLKEFFEILKSTASNTGMLSLILASALLFGFSITLIELPQTIQMTFESLEMNKWIILLLVFLLFAILGMFMEVVSVLLIIVPILYPIMGTYGFDLIWFGIFAIIAMEMAAITPPVGLNLFIMMQVSEKQKNKMNILQMSRAAFPFLLLMVLLIVIITILPQLVTWLPEVLDS